MVKTLKQPPRNGRHVLGCGFGSKADGGYVFLHIDESKYEGRPLSYYVQLYSHPWAKDDEPTVRPDRDWAYEQVEALVGEKPIPGVFFDAELTATDLTPPSAIAAAPMAIGGRALPLTGVEYGADVDLGVYRFSWAKVAAGIRVKVSYTVNGYLPSDFRTSLEQERNRVRGFIREAFRL
jgi:hypothetical protein